MSAMKPILLGALVAGACASGAVAAKADENKEAKVPPPTSVSAVNTPTAPPNPAPKPPLIEQLEALVAGLEMPSETDAPIHAFWSEESMDEPTPADYARLAGLDVRGDEPIEMRSLGDLLDGPATEETWMSEDDRATARRFAALRAFLNANFAEIEVLSFGTTQKQIVVVGRTENGFAGLITLVVET